ncbi:amidohydrolase [Streptoalloteichus tenebrarius]|uniref:amidohydrolase n=1 Tax=Streptoalloteichus tenebrarius (strain ATCC 17920 / DSM 40477 / JCM 4838 / CBS 697.72 / NBRC 16177 / NCIMB 11028 / NRRL B-12390 / A12253. 1 / ISP 5477) TaxID=1933 RepID=UPI0020A60585|nr:amidohydrolase [Streptoalloteichus tenebrarius]
MGHRGASAGVGRGGGDDERLRDVARRAARRAGDVLSDLEGRLPELRALYEDLHRNPELSGQERRTAAIVADRFAAAGLTTTPGVGGTGVVGLLRNGDGPVVMVRGDMDALPIAERTGLPYASTASGALPDGSATPVMHACGHDVHTVALIGSVEALARARDTWSGTLLAVAQPAEETAEGALALLADGLFTRFPKPDVAVGQHVQALPVGLVAHSPDVLMSAATNVEIRIFGRGGHGSFPEAAVDPVVVAAFLVVRLQTIVSRELAPAEPAVVTVGALHAGSRANVIPDEARLSVNVRVRSDATRDRVVAAIRRIADAETRAARCPREPEITLSARFPLTRNDSALDGLIRATHEEFLGEGSVITIDPVMGSEDFAYYGLPGPGRYEGAPVPYSFWFFGGTLRETWDETPGAGLAKLGALPGPHTATFAPDPDGSLATGVRALVSAVLASLASEEGAPPGHPRQD